MSIFENETVGGAGGAHKILCPFCNKLFSPEAARFRFEFDNGRRIEYFSIQEGTASYTKMRRYCDENDYNCKVRKVDGVSIEMTLEGKMTNIVSPLRVCANEDCNQILSGNAGYYEPGNGIFFLGLKGSGKTVMITALLEVLRERAGWFDCCFSAYNKTVQREYETHYYDVMYNERKLPAASIIHNQLTYEWQNIRTRQAADLTITDIRGEDADDEVRIFSGELGMNIQKSKAFVVTIDLKELVESDLMVQKTASIFQDVLQKTTYHEDRQKYLAIVITKSDSLINKYHYPIFHKDSRKASPIYSQLDYSARGRELKDRNEVDEGLREVLSRYCQPVVTAAERIFSRENVGYFAVSALGCAPNGSMLGNDRPTPIRVEEPVLWLLQKMGLI